MERKKLIEVLQEQFPKEAAWVEDFVGLQIEGKTDIKKIMVTLDITNDVIFQASTQNIDMIISHHPFYFGKKEDVIKNNHYKKAQDALLQKLGINVFAIHTNADFNPNSIAFYQANALDLESIEQLNLNQGTIGTLKKQLKLAELVKLIRKILELNYDFRTNVDFDAPIKSIIFGSGAAGDIIHLQKNLDSLYIIGEIKHHQWIAANEQQIKLLEIGHYSEFIFKHIIKIYLEQETDLEIILSKEENGYKTI